MCWLTGYIDTKSFWKDIIVFEDFLIFEKWITKRLTPMFDKLIDNLSKISTFS